MRRGPAARRWAARGRAARGLAAAAVYALSPLIAATVGGCGGGTKTVTASGVGAAAGETTSTASGAARGAPSTTSKARTSTSASTLPAPSQTAPGGSTTRTAPEPAFAQNGATATAETSGAEVAAAVATVKTHGYTPNDTSEYHADQTLRVLTATRTGSADGYSQRAFFFLDGRYIGTDASEPSASVRVVSQGDTEVVLAYPLYRAHDPLCCPAGGEAKVHFQLNDGRLVPLQPIPPVSSASGLSRQ
jgi:LppP/LprE lipoprotein